MNKQGGLMENAELIKALKEDAEWAHANEWETPITLGDHLDAAADALEAADKRVKELETIVTNAEKCDFENRTDCDYCENIQRAVIRIAELEAAQRWISVGERLPDDVGSYLVYYHEWSNGDFLPKYDDYRIRVMRFMNNGKWRMPVCSDKRCEADTNREVTHWQHLPQPPEKGE